MGVDCDYPKPCQCGCHFPASEDATARKPAPSYSPVYCALYPELAKVAREHGYALAIHGSLVRDFDLIAVPWVECPAEPEALVGAFTSRFALHRMDKAPTAKPHGRAAYTISVGFGECAIDLSFTPREDPAIREWRDRLCSAMADGQTAEQFFRVNVTTQSGGAIRIGERSAGKTLRFGGVETRPYEMPPVNTAGPFRCFLLDEAPRLGQPDEIEGCE